ncbi:Fic/DOC family protein [uncultured archaeon]|nr:Fic/DOC family protein [uncultured archaeon]
MVTLKEKKIGGRTYYYLGHTYRANGKVKYQEVYLGTKKPKSNDLTALKNDFVFAIYKERWFSRFDEIKEAYSKERRALPAEIEKKETERFAVQFTYDTNRIEGSRLTLRETGALLERGTTPPGRPLSDIKEAEAHRKVFYEVLAYKKDLTMSIMLEWHREVFEDTKPRIAGKLRDYQVGISGSRFLPPSPVEIYPLLREFFRWYDREKARMHPVELAALVHLRFVTIHPFGDGNGRISRLLMNFVLHKHGYPMLNIEYKNRSSYYTALERSQTKKNESIFVQWLFKKYLNENERYAKISLKRNNLGQFPGMLGNGDAKKLQKTVSKIRKRARSLNARMDISTKEWADDVKTTRKEQ